MLGSASRYVRMKLWGLLYYVLLGNHTIFNRSYNELVIIVKQIY